MRIQCYACLVLLIDVIWEVHLHYTPYYIEAILQVLEPLFCLLFCLEA